MNDLSPLYQSQFRKHWTVRQPEPLQMTDSEVLDWIAEHCEQVVYCAPSAAFVQGWNLFVPELPRAVKGYTLREAVCLAAAKLKQANE